MIQSQVKTIVLVFMSSSPPKQDLAGDQVGLEEQGLDDVVPLLLSPQAPGFQHGYKPLIICTWSGRPRHTHPAQPGSRLQSKS